MVTFLTGFPGSGKSYFEVEKIYNIVNKNHTLSKSIEVIYTNINGFKFELFEDTNIKVKKLNVDDFYTYLAESYSIYSIHKNSDNVDEHLIKHTKEKGYFNCLIAFDECHEFLTSQDKVKVYWLTYHRHLHHEVDLLTQNKALINSKYRSIPEIFIEAQPRSKKLFSNTLSYKHYASFSMRKADLFNTSSIKAKDEVFKLYQSGNTSKQKSILRKFILIALIGLLFTAILFYFMFQSLKAEEPIKEDTPKQNPTNTVPIKSNEPIINDDSISLDSKLIKFVYDSRKGYLYNNHYYSNYHFKKFIKKTNSKLVSKYSVITNKNYKMFYYYVRTDDISLKQFFIMPTVKEDSSNISDINLNL